MDQVYSHMKELEIDLPALDDSSVVARVRRLHFYSVREDFINVWKHHEQFLLDYEGRVKKTMQRQAKIGNCITKLKSVTTQNWYKFLLVYIFQVDAYITEEESEALIANNTTSLFVGNVNHLIFIRNQVTILG